MRAPWREDVNRQLFVQEKKKAKNGLNCLQVLATHLFNKYLLSACYVPSAWRTAMNETNNNNKRKVHALVTRLHSNGRNHTINKILKRRD